MNFNKVQKGKTLYGNCEPNSEKKKIEDMKAVLASAEKGKRNVLLFTLGINTVVLQSFSEK